MGQDNAAAPSHTELIDSILHSDKKRMAKGLIAGLAAGFLMVVLSTFFAPAGTGKLWWLQLAASLIYGGEATRYDSMGPVLATGAVIHFTMSAFLGFVYGKITQTRILGRLLAYGLVLGALCWLSSNMFAPDFLNITALGEVGQWLRMLLFQTFTLSLSFFVYILVR
jgi:hypothetical protein